jgi:hypothetical protein
MARTTEKPERPNLSSRELETLASTQTELLSELWILRDRVLVLEHLLAEAGILKPGQLDGYVPQDKLAGKLDAERDQFVARVVGAGHRKSFSVDSLKAQAAKEREIS